MVSVYSGAGRAVGGGGGRGKEGLEDMIGKFKSLNGNTCKYSFKVRKM